MAASLRIKTRQYSFAVAENAPAYMGDVQTPQHAVEIARSAIGENIAESLLVLFCDSRNRVFGFNECARGNLNANRFQPRDVITPALLANAAAIIICHNHPSGDPSPSSPDRHVTTVLRDACNLIGIRLLDHLIVTADGYYSLRESGDLPFDS